MKSRIYIYIILTIILIIVYSAGCRRAGSLLVKEDGQYHTDVLVILMGSIPDRVLQAADLYHLNVAEKVIVVEESMGGGNILEERGVRLISNTTQVINAMVLLGIPADSIIKLQGDATSTQMEATIVRDYLKDKPGVDSLVLVTSSFHSRRAAMIFIAALKNIEKPIIVLSSPSKYSNFDADHWWMTKEGRQIVIFEYLKLANFLLFERNQLV
jgi:uncharacterized SAM-binding protein YcdF (DUF218 family)